MNVKSIGDRIRELRKTHQETQEQLAAKLGVKRSAVGMYEQNKRTPDIETLKKIATLYDVSIDWLAGSDKSALREISTGNSNVQEDKVFIEYNKLPETSKEKVKEFIDMLNSYNSEKEDDKKQKS